ncbi:MAG: hypothetical protein K2K34_10460 [Oscillospiraceae bacterium]|nr:hypothetical protein [Oscillospiraceae bacterium]
MRHDFHYISKHDPEVKKAYNDILNMLKKVQKLLSNEFKFSFYVVGSYKRNMITYDTKSNVGYDFDFNIKVNDDSNKYSPKELKNMLQSAIGKVCIKYGYDYPEDSTRVLTIKKKDRKKSRIIHSCDFAIVNNYIDDEEYERQKYIHYNKSQKKYIWCKQPDGYYMLPDKIDWIKENRLWNAVRDLYIEKKNKNDDPNIHSRTILAITVHEICQRYGFYENEKIQQSESCRPAESQIFRYVTLRL